MGSLRPLLSPPGAGEGALPARCHLCALWASLFEVPSLPLARESSGCLNCRGERGVRRTVRRAIASANPLLSKALLQVEEPIELEERA